MHFISLFPSFLIYSFFVDDGHLLDVPWPLIDQNEWWTGFFDYGKPWTTIDENDPEQNPWRVYNEQLMVPFDAKVYNILLMRYNLWKAKTFHSYDMPVGKISYTYLTQLQQEHKPFGDYIEKPI